MPFAFPIAENRFGDLFQQGIANAIATYQRARSLRDQRTLMELEHPGFHFGAIPSVADAARQLPNATTAPTSVDTSIVLPTTQGGGVQQTPSATPLHITSPAVSISQPNQFHQTIANALAAMPRSERNAPVSTINSDYIPLSGGYLNTSEMMQRLAPQMELAARGKFLDALATAQGTVAGNPARQDYYTSRQRYFDARANQIDNPAGKPGKPVRSTLIRTRDGYVAVNPVTNEVTPLEDENGQPVLTPSPASRTSNPNSETPAHRNARQAAAATLPILRNTQAQMVPLQKQLGSPFATAADSARIGPLLGNLQQRADSLQQAYAGHVHDMDAAAGGASNTPAPKQLPPLTAAQKARAARDPQFKTFLGRQGYQEPDFR